MTILNATLLIGSSCRDVIDPASDVVPVATVPALSLDPVTQTLVADGASRILLKAKVAANSFPSITFATSRGMFVPANAATATVPIEGDSGQVYLQAPSDSGALTVSATYGGAVAIRTIPVAPALPEVLTIAPDSLVVSDTGGRRTISISASRSIGVVTKGTRIDLRAYSQDSVQVSANSAIVATGRPVGIIDSPVLTDATGAGTAHFSLVGDDGRHSGLITIVGVAESTLVVSQVTLSIVPPGTPVLDLTADSVLFVATSTTANPSSQSIQVSNGGTGTLGSISLGTITYISGGTSGWLTVSAGATAAPTSISVQATTIGLGAGMYVATFPVIATAFGVAQTPQIVTVILMVP